MASPLFVIENVNGFVVDFRSFYNSFYNPFPPFFGILYFVIFSCATNLSMSNKMRKKKSHRGTLSVKDAFSKILEGHKMILYREGLKQHQEKRVQEAFALLNRPSRPNGTATPSRQEYYGQFLKNVHKNSGFQLVILCAVALGQSAIGIMSDRSRLDLSEKIKGNEDTLKCDVLQMLVEKFSKGQHCLISLSRI